MSDVEKGHIISGSGQVISNADAFAALNQIVQVARQYGIVRQTEQTKRAAIAASVSVQVERIQAAEATLKMYFDRVFEERKKNTDEMFERLDQAMSSGDAQMVHSVVRGIVDLAGTSPLAGLEDFAQFWAEIGTAENPVEL